MPRRFLTLVPPEPLARRLVLFESRIRSSALRCYWPLSRTDLYGFLLVLALMYGCYAYYSFSGFQGLYYSNGNLLGRDFAIVWFAARLVLEGKAAVLYDNHLFHAAHELMLHHAFPPHIWVYPPHAIPLILVFGFLPYVGALALWTFAPLLFYIIAVAARRGRQDLGVLISLLIAPSTFESVVCGQNGFIMAGLLAGGLRMLETRPVLAGVFFGVLTVKPHMGIVLPFALLAARAWKTVASAVLTSLVLIGLSYALYGGELWETFFTVTMPGHRAMLESILRQYNALMMPTFFMAVRQLGGSVALAYAAAGLAAAGAIAMTVAVFLRPGVSIEQRAAFVLTATAVGSPYLHSYDLPLVSAAMVLLAYALKGRPLPVFASFWCMLAWMLPLFVVNLNAARFPVSPILLAGFLCLQFYVIYAKPSVAFRRID